jgi:hypothetical protein
MGGAWKLSALLAAALCAALLAACGGDSDSDSTATTATDSTAAEAPANPSDGGNSGDDSGGKGSKSGGKDGGDGGSGGDSSGNGNGDSSGSPDGKGNSSGVSGSASFDFSGEPTKHKHPAAEEGKRSDVFVVPGGDNSIQEYGEEQGDEERTAAMLPIAALYKAQFTGNWSEVCDTYLSANNVEQIKLLTEKSPQLKGKSCAEALSGLTQGTGIKTPDTPDGGVVSFRVDGETGFAIYWGIDGKGYAFALKSEGGGWKLTSLAPTPLQP